MTASTDNDERRVQWPGQARPPETAFGSRAPERGVDHEPEKRQQRNQREHGAAVACKSWVVN